MSSKTLPEASSGSSRGLPALRPLRHSPSASATSPVKRHGGGEVLPSPPVQPQRDGGAQSRTNGALSHQGVEAGEGGFQLGLGVPGVGQPVAVLIDHLLGGPGQEVGVVELLGGAVDVGGPGGDFLGQARALGGEIDEIGDGQGAGGFADDEGRRAGRGAGGLLRPVEPSEGEDQRRGVEPGARAFRRRRRSGSRPAGRRAGRSSRRAS